MEILNIPIHNEKTTIDTLRKVVGENIILMHKIKPEMEKQVIGRAQRPGRKSVLHIHRLLHQNEL